MYVNKPKNNQSSGQRPVRTPFFFILAGFMVAVLLLCVSSPAFSADASLYGALKTFTMGVYDSTYQEDLYGFNTTLLRLNGSFYPASWLGLTAAYQLYSQIQPVALPRDALAHTTHSTEYRIGEIPERIYPREKKNVRNRGLYNDLDRAFITLSLPFADLYVGRQAVSWGSAHVFNPTDLFAPYAFNELNSEEKKGVDAARLRIPIGAMNEIDLGYVAGEDFTFTKSAVYARSRFYVLQTDISLMVIDFRENLLAGVDITRSIGNAGSWLESAYVIPDTFDPDEYPDTSTDYFMLSTGLDYSFSEKLYGYAEYHFNSAGQKKAENYLDVAEDPADHPAYNEGNAYLFGRHYLMLGATLTVTPLFPVSVLTMLNMNDWSVALSVSGEYNIAENVYITGGCYIGAGENPKTAAAPGSPLPVITEYNTEFGTYPNLFYLAFKAYF